ncbi:unnamed protein product [Periconia digitata]|uniref:Major facilitator superfamily (MFS) profile domain-containing protein n=1 Tax=Periconia digitata TaxID=1303443 RepID=A0A9W4TYZ8_9PLEO|nr:unnamed protein product [Periconia digitata]
MSSPEERRPLLQETFCPDSTHPTAASTDDGERGPMDTSSHVPGKDDDSSPPNNEPESLYDLKCRMVDLEIESLGMGKYQWRLWALCGLGYLIDLMWAQAFGLILSPMQQELGFGDAQTGNLSTAFSCGLTMGAFMWGILVDIIGRKWAFNLTVLTASVFGMCLGLPDTYPTILMLTALIGWGVGGNIPIDTLITLEFTPSDRRYLLPLLSIFQPIGVTLCSIIAYGFIPAYSCSPNFTELEPLPTCVGSKIPTQSCCTKSDNMGWRYLLFTLGTSTTACFLLRCFAFDVQESPKFLIHKDRDVEAIKVLHHVAKINGKPSSLTLESFQKLEADWDTANGVENESSMMNRSRQLQKSWSQKCRLEADRFKILFSTPRMAKLTTLVWLTYVFDYSGFTIAGQLVSYLTKGALSKLVLTKFTRAGFYLPQIIALKNGALSLSLRYTYCSYIFIYFPGTIGVLLGSLLYRTRYFGRKYTMVLSSALMGISILAFSTINTAASTIGLNMTEYIFQSMFNAVLYGWTPEVFPASIRGTACGLASFWGRLFGIISPLIAQRIYGGGTGNGKDANSVLYLAGGVSLLCVVTTVLLPSSSVTKSRP